MPRSGTLPKSWKSGPDPIDHVLYTDCQRARAQARYRGEEWTITEQQFIDIWRTDDLYLNKGRSPQHLCMTRIDPSQGWHVDNVHIISRHTHYKNTIEYKRRKHQHELI